MTWQTDAFQTDLFQIGGFASASGATVAFTPLDGATGAPSQDAPLLTSRPVPEQIGGVIPADQKKRSAPSARLESSGRWVKSDDQALKEQLARWDALDRQYAQEQEDKRRIEAEEQAKAQAILEALAREARTRRFKVAAAQTGRPAAEAPKLTRLVPFQPLAGPVKPAAAPFACVVYSAADLLAERNRFKTELDRLRRDQEDLAVLLLAS